MNSKNFYRSYIWFLLVGYIVVLIGCTSAIAYQQVRSARNFVLSVRNDILIGNFRSVSVVLSGAQETIGYSQISLSDTKGETIFSLDERAGNHLVPFSFKERVGLDEQSKSFFVVEFSVNLLPTLLLISALWLFVAMSTFPFARFHAQRLEMQFTESLRRERLEQVGRIARQFAHDIRSPLSALKLLGSRVESDRFSGDLFRTAVLRLEGIAADLLTKESDEAENTQLAIALEQSGASVERSDRVRTVDFLQQVRILVDLKHIEYSAYDKNVRLSARFHVVAEPLEEMSANLDTMIRVISNLLNNSFEAIKTDGFISLETISDEKNLLILIRDNGCGISSENLKIIFNEEVSVGKSSGTGIGLSHARKSIEGCGGFITLDSIPNRGTTVTVSLPLYESSETERVRDQLLLVTPT